MLKFTFERFCASQGISGKFSSCLQIRKASDLSGRDFVDPLKLTINDYKHIIWSAMDIKEKLSERGKQNFKLLESKHVSILLIKPSFRTQVSYTLACDILGAKHTQYIDLDFESQPDVTDSGRAVSKLTDLVVVNGISQANLNKFASGCTPPVIGTCTNLYSIQKALSDIMTILEKYKYLKGLTFAWIGPSTALCNTFLCILPLFGVNIKYCCMCTHGTGNMSPLLAEEALKQGKNTCSELHQCESAEKALNNAHIIATSMHPENLHQITLKTLERDAEFNWSFIHSLPRTSVEVADDVYMHKNNITWDCSANNLYIAMALLACTLCGYRPDIPEPDFDALKC